MHRAESTDAEAHIVLIVQNLRATKKPHLAVIINSGHLVRLCSKIGSMYNTTNAEAYACVVQAAKLVQLVTDDPISSITCIHINKRKEPIQGCISSFLRYNLHDQSNSHKYDVFSLKACKSAFLWCPEILARCGWSIILHIYQATLKTTLLGNVCGVSSTLPKSVVFWSIWDI